MTRSGDDAVLNIDLDGSAAFAAPTLNITFSNGWTAGGLSVGLEELLQQNVIKT